MIGTVIMTSDHRHHHHRTDNTYQVVTSLDACGLLRAIVQSLMIFDSCLLLSRHPFFLALMNKVFAHFACR